MRKFAAFLLVFCAAAVLFLPRAGAQNSPRLPKTAAPQKDLSRLLRRYERLRLNEAETVGKIKRGERLSFVTSEGNLEVELVPNDLRGKSYKAEETGADGVRRQLPAQEVRTFRGKVEGVEGAEARFNLADGSFEGMIATPGDRFYFERLGKYEETAEAGEFIFYRASDVLEDAPGFCGATLDDEVKVQAAGALEQVTTQSAATQSVTMAGATTLLQADVATEADYEYVTALGGSAAANAEILSIMNLVDGIYESQLGLSLKVVYQHAWASKPAGYPYTAAVEGSTVLNEFTNHWNTAFANVARDTAHMWTGKDITANGSTGLAGIAWVGVVCSSPGHAYGVSQRFANVSIKQALTAHEIGHNFGASHSDGQTGCASTIMSATVSDLLSFCDYSKGQIGTHTSTYGSCLTPVAAAAPALSTLTLGASSTANGAPVSGRVTLTAPASANGAVVTLSDNLAATTLPASVLVPAGQTSASFTITSTAVTAAQTGTVTAAYGGVTKTAAFSVVPGLTIAGSVLNGTAGVSGVTVTLTSTTAGFTPQTTTSSSTGAYSFTNLGSGRTYVVTASSPVYNFTPTSLTLSNVGSSAAGQNFLVASRKSYAIGGKVLNGTAGMAGRDVRLTSTNTAFAARTATTAADGSYSFTNVPAGYNYTVSVSSATYNFSPASRGYTSLAANQAGQNFSVLSRKTYTIGGAVRNAAGAALAGVTMTLTNTSTGAVAKTVLTAADGTYSLTGVSAGYNYVLKPSLTGRTFTPTSKSYTTLIANQAGQNFVGQ